MSIISQAFDIFFGFLLVVATIDSDFGLLNVKSQGHKNFHLFVCTRLDGKDYYFSQNSTSTTSMYQDLSKISAFGFPEHPDGPLKASSVSVCWFLFSSHKGGINNN